MNGSQPEENHLTHLADGRRVSSRELAGVVYEDLHRMAQVVFRQETPGITLQPTALVHEVYLKLAEQKVEGGWENRAHFLSVAATAMRRVLINAARERRADKRGGGNHRVTWIDGDAVEDDRTSDLLDLESALERLAGIKERYVRIVELRTFAGLTVPEVARVLGVTGTVVDREWARARAYLALWLEE